jgi:23S rRNA (uracil1939-C5)-methyltransferase
MIKSPASTSLRPGDVVEIECTDLIAKTGQAVGRADGMVVYVWGPIPGERARVRIETVKAKYAIGELIELLSHSPDRALPFCPVFGACGGCQVQHVAYESQLRWKRSLVANALQRLGGVKDARVGPPIGMDAPRAYRNKMSLVVDHAGATPAFGFYAARSHDVVRIHACPIVLPRLDGVIDGLWKAAADEASVQSFERAQHVVARAGRSSGEGVVAVTTGLRSPQLGQRSAALAAHLPGVVGVVNSYEPPSENAVMGRKQTTTFGRAEIEEAIEGVRFLVSPASFFQVNSEMVGKIFSFIAPHLQGMRSIVDLYCGAGTFSLFFAMHGARVVGIEENPHAVREARANAKMNRVEDKTSFIVGRVDATLRSKLGIDALGGADLAFLDPPRKGSDDATLDALLRARVPHIWYLSCNPAMLARDVARLIAGGYRLGPVQPFDMFPQTGHVEALASIYRSDVTPPSFPNVEGP